MIQKVGIQDFLYLAKTHPVLDVRSPSEYIHAHIPGAHNLPLFSDEERKIVGTLYKQQGRQMAIKAGLDYFGPKMSKMVSEVESIVNTHRGRAGIYSNTLLVHCWRGGMRSAGVAWLLDLYGFKVYTLTGGYKSFRSRVLRQFQKPYQFTILGGNTGSGKTIVLKELSAHYPVIDLEGLAGHRGSAFGALGEARQPTQEMFENLLASALDRISDTNQDNNPIWLEDESRRIGLINLPTPVWESMQQSLLVVLDVPFEKRLQYTVDEYGTFPKEELINAILRIRKRLGGLNAKNAIGYLLEDNFTEAFRILLHYYDKVYERTLIGRCAPGGQQVSVSCDRVDPANFRKLTDIKHTNNGIPK